jgi:pimeloyl-ACP methyl ester carboxylesterase
MSSRSQWQKLVAQADQEFRFIPVDLLGYGRAAFPAEHAGFSLGHEIDAVMTALAAHLDSGEPFHLVGHSYGGATALRMALDLGPRVLSLAVFEPVAFGLLRGDPGGAAAYAEIAAIVAAIDGAADAHDAARVFIDYWNRPGTFDGLPEALRERFAAQIAKVRLDFAALLGEPATLADVGTLDLPALVLSGSASPQTTRRLAALLARTLPGARHLETAGGHMAPITHAQPVNDALCAFLRSAARQDHSAPALALD